MWRLRWVAMGFDPAVPHARMRVWLERRIDGGWTRVDADGWDTVSPAGVDYSGAEDRVLARHGLSRDDVVEVVEPR